MNTFESFLAVQGRNQVYSECCFAKKPVQTSSAKQTKKLRALAPSSSKFNLKRHQKDINFRWLFHVFLGFWAQKPKNTRKSHWKLMSFPCLFRLNFEGEGAIALPSNNKPLLRKCVKTRLVFLKLSHFSTYIRFFTHDLNLTGH